MADGLKQAIFKIQGTVSKVHKDGENPYHNSSYPTLESVLDALNKAIHENGIVLTQFTEHKEYGWVLVTKISHSSDLSESSSSETPLFGIEESTNKMQALGSSITYARRYALMSLFKLAPTDDDAESAGMQFVKEPPRAAKTEPRPKDYKIPEGRYKGKKTSEVPAEALLGYINEIEQASKESGRAHPKWFLELKKAVAL
jgi:hypothetical protein